ncbi:MAG: hypothetical protein QM734_10325 [Cyclobacteriaceae bacterium]
MAEDEKIVIRSLLYFDIFNYPITTAEIIRFAPVGISESIQGTIDNLVAQRKIFRLGEFYSLQDNNFLAERRISGNKLAEEKMTVAKKYAKIISFFPFVRAVMLSGSISKGYMDDKSDIDYFIITEKNRLWISRTLLILFRRIFLFNSHKNFCTNYFVDKDNLEIIEKNIFTAIEFSTLVQMFDQQATEAFNHSNRWIKDFLPNEKEKSVELKKDKTFTKTLIEGAISLIVPDQLNHWLKNRTISYWKKKYGNELSQADFEIAFKSTEGISKSHPQFFQKKVLGFFDQKINRYEIEHGLDLSL